MSSSDGGEDWETAERCVCALERRSRIECRANALGGVQQNLVQLPYSAFPVRMSRKGGESRGKVGEGMRRGKMCLGVLGLGDVACSFRITRGDGCWVPQGGDSRQAKQD